MPPAQLLANLLNAAPQRPVAEVHIEQVAAAVSRLLHSEFEPALRRRLNDWPRLAADASDLCQLTALAFIAAYQADRLRPDAATGDHTVRSVCAYLHGISRVIFKNAARRRRPVTELVDEPLPPVEPSLLDTLLGTRHDGEDEETRIWRVLASLRPNCKSRDLLMLYLYCNGFSPGEIRKLFNVSINIPATAFKRVGEQLRRFLGARTT